jgi:hypothetical protein
VGWHPFGWPPHGHDGGFLGPEQLAQLLSLGASHVAVVTLAHIPAPVGITRRGVRASRRPPAKEWNDRGVEPGRAIEGRELLARAYLHRGIDQVADHRFKALPAQRDLGLGQLVGQRVEGRLGHDPVLHPAARVHHPEGEVEQVAHTAIAGEEGPRGARLAVHAQLAAPTGREPAVQQPGGRL